MNMNINTVILWNKVSYFCFCKYIILRAMAKAWSDSFKGLIRALTGIRSFKIRIRSFHLLIRDTVRGVSEMAQKVIEGDVDTWSHMHAILRWPKFRTIQFLSVFSRREMVFEAKIVRILGHLWIFGLKKVGYPRILTCDLYFEPKRSIFIYFFVD